MIGFLGYNFLGDRNSLDPVPTTVGFDQGGYGNAEFDLLVIRKNYAQVKVNGEWKMAEEIYVNVDGVWKTMNELNMKIDEAIITDKIYEI